MVTELLVKSRTSIHEINTVRKHLSKLKGGWLAKICRASTILSLIISDVPRNRLADIASGATVEDPTTYNDAVEILKAHNLWNHVSENIRNHLTKGLMGEIPETPKPGDPAFQRVHNVIIADNRTACEAVKKALGADRIQSTILTSCAEMEAKSMGRLLASVARDHTRHGNVVLRSGAVIIGGETTVQVKGEGIGGRNQETALSAVEPIADLDGCVITTLGTDGIDGNSKAAGAVTDGRTAQRAELRGMNSRDFLSRNDSYHFFRKLSDNLITGPTGTNVGDLYLVACSK
jgi:glycerate-2-kinase